MAIDHLRRNRLQIKQQSLCLRCCLHRSRRPHRPCLAHRASGPNRPHRPRHHRLPQQHRAQTVPQIAKQSSGHTHPQRRARPALKTAQPRVTRTSLPPRQTTNPNSTCEYRPPRANHSGHHTALTPTFPPSCLPAFLPSCLPFLPSAFWLPSFPFLFYLFSFIFPPPLLPFSGPLVLCVSPFFCLPCLPSGSSSSSVSSALNHGTPPCLATRVSRLPVLIALLLPPPLLSCLSPVLWGSA